MKTQIIFTCFLFVLLTKITFGSSETDALNKYHQANIAYQKLDYESSIRLYGELIKNNTISPEIYYNLANSYFKAGNFAKAILNFERAKKLEPDDEDVNFNLKIASLKVVDKIESVPEIFYKRWVNRISTMFPANTFSVFLILMIWLLFISAAIYRMGRSVVLKKISFILMTFFLILSVGSGVLASRSHAIASIDQQAILMSSSVYVKSSPHVK